MWCPSCGAENPIEYRFCGICGTTLEDQAIRPSPSRYPAYPADPRDDSNSRNDRLFFFGVSIAGLLLFVCVFCLISASLVGWLALNPLRSPQPLLTNTPISIDSSATLVPQSGDYQKWRATDVLAAFKRAGWRLRIHAP